MLREFIYLFKREHIELHKAHMKSKTSCTDGLLKVSTHFVCGLGEGID